MEILATEVLWFDGEGFRVMQWPTFALPKEMHKTLEEDSTEDSGEQCFDMWGESPEAFSASLESPSGIKGNQ